MANLGKLFFELGLKDNTDKDINRIRKNVESRLKELGVNVKITPDLSDLKKVNVEINTDTSQMINEIKTQLESADITLTPKVSINDAAKSISGAKVLTINAGSIENINKILRQQRSEAEEAARALLGYQQSFYSFTKKSTAATGSIKAMEAELNKLRDTYRSLSEVDRNSAIGKGLLQQLNNADEALAKVNAEMANNAALAKAMGTRYNGLQVQISQVARELPNFAMSFSTGIISLSNNLPMLADEIARVRQEVELARKSGQTVTPVWKQILAGLLNWQTALIVGITVLVAYSDEIANWAEALIKGGDAAIYLAESQKKFNDLQRQASSDASKEISKLELLYNTTQNTTVSIDARREAVEKLQQMYPEYLGKLSEEAILAGKASDAYKLLADSLKNAASLRLIEEQRAKATQALADAKTKEMKAQEEINSLMKAMGASTETEMLQNAANISPTNYAFLSRIVRARDEARKIQKAILEDAEKWNEQYSSIFDKSINTGQLEVLFRDMPEYRIYGETLEDLERSLSLSEITLEEYNQKVNEAKGILLAAADAAKIGGSEVEKLRAEYTAFNRVLNEEKTNNSDSGRLQEDLLLSSKKLQQAVRKAELDMELSRLNLMEEGGEKELAQLKYNHRKRLAEIDKQKNELIQKAREAEKAQWMTENPGANESAFVSQISGVGNLPQEFQNILSGLIETEDKLYKKSIEDYYKSVAQEFQSYLEKRKAIEDEYDRKATTLFQGGASMETLQELSYQKEQALSAVDSEYAQREKTYRVWVSQITNMGLEELRRMLMEAEAQLRLAEANAAVGNGSETDLAIARAQVAELRKQLEELQKANSKGATESNEGWEETYKVLEKVNRSFDEIGDSVGGVAGEIIKQAGKMSSSILQVVNSVKALQGGLKGIEAASGVLTIISSGMQAVSGLFSLFNRTDYMEEFRKEAAELNEELRKVKESARIDSGLHNTIFGDDAWKNATDNISAANDALERYDDTLKEISQRKVFSDLPKFVREFNNGMLDQLRFDNVTDSLKNMQVQIRHSTWFRSAKYMSLAEAAPELFNPDDTVNMEALAEFVNKDMFQKLSEENQQYLQEMLDNWSVYEDALGSVKNYLTDIFGDMGNTLMDALVDAFENGTDAAQAFTDSVSDMLEQLATNMIYSVAFGELFSQAQEDMLGIMKDESKSEEEKFAGYTAILQGLISDALGQQDMATALMEKFQEMAEDAGLDIYTPSQEEESKQTGLPSSIQGVTEDTANLLGSYLNAIRHDVSVERSVMENIGTTILPTISITAQAQLQQLNAIATNTKTNADAAVKIQEFLEGRLASVITQGSGGMALRMK